MWFANPFFIFGLFECTMKNFSQFALLCLAVFIATLTVADAYAQSSDRVIPGYKGSSSSSGGARGSGYSPSRGSSVIGGSSALGRSSTGGGSASRGRSFTRGGSSTRSGSSTRRGAPTRDDEAQEPLTPEAEKAIADLEKIQQEITQLRRYIDKQFREMPIGFADAQMKTQKAIETAKKQQLVLEEQLTEKGLEVFRLAPFREQFSTQIALDKLNSSLTPTAPGTQFNPGTAKELIEVLLKDENAQVPVLKIALKVYYVLHDFKRAGEILDRLEEYGPVKDIYYEVLEETNQAWQDEVAIRRVETATGDLPYALVETSEGTFKIELFENQATATVYDFVSRAERGFYDGLPFHDVKPGEYARAGVSRETGVAANDSIVSEASKETARKHFAGSVSMVSSSDGQTTSSVFQICHQPNLDFNGKHTVFGRIVDLGQTFDGQSVKEGAMELVYRFKRFDLRRFDNREEASVIKKITIMNKRDHDYKNTVAASVSEPSSDGLGSAAKIDLPSPLSTTSSFDLLPQGNTQN